MAGDDTDRGRDGGAQPPIAVGKPPTTSPEPNHRQAHPLSWLMELAWDEPVLVFPLLTEEALGIPGKHGGPAAQVINICNTTENALWIICGGRR